MISIAAVVVTFNRKTLLVENLEALLAQTRPLDRIYIIDNASMDGTEALLDERGFTGHPNIAYQRLPENVGGAGGFAAGLKKACEAGHDWLWVMDDDAEPVPNALERLAAHLSTPNTTALASLVVNTTGTVDFAHRGWFKPLKGDSIVRRIGPEILKGATVVPIEFSSFVGTCFSSATVKAAGLPKSEFFICHDDVEYSLRLRSVGHIMLVTDSVIRHKEMTTNALIDKKVFGISPRLRIDYDKLWLHFFGYRNLIWLASHKRISARLFTIVVLHVRKLLGVILYDDHKIRRIWLWNAALFDGIRGNFDNSKPRRLLRRP